MLAPRIVSRLARFIIFKGISHYSIQGRHLGNEDTLFQFRLYLLTGHFEFKSEERLSPAIQASIPSCIFEGTNIFVVLKRAFLINNYRSLFAR